MAPDNIIALAVAAVATVASGATAFRSSAKPGLTRPGLQKQFKTFRLLAYSVLANDVFFASAHCTLQIKLFQDKASHGSVGAGLGGPWR